jgi:hypothetical protein
VSLDQGRPRKVDRICFADWCPATGTNTLSVTRNELENFLDGSGADLQSVPSLNMVAADSVQTLQIGYVDIKPIADAG